MRIDLLNSLSRGFFRFLKCVKMILVNLINTLATDDIPVSSNRKYDLKRHTEEKSVGCRLRFLFCSDT
ncbi:hypothetical protein 055SW001_6 [Bacillus phage 055SW001]|nr:hypothetical protein 055SW001_6 [Bacillus phage 055SW001]